MGLNSPVDRFVRVDDRLVLEDLFLPLSLLVVFVDKWVTDSVLDQFIRPVLVLSLLVLPLS